MSDDEEVIFLGSRSQFHVRSSLATSRSQVHVRSSLAEFIPDDDDDPETVIDDSGSSDDDFANLVNQDASAARGSTEMPAAGGSTEQSAAGGSMAQSAAGGSTEQSAAGGSTEQSAAGADPKLPKKEKKGKGKKRKAIESVEEDNDEGSCCTICFEPWSNSGEHRVSSLRCGHFFGYGCIEKWLKGTGSSCPNCNEKSTKKEIRVHYISKLKAIDTSEKDRALADLEKERTTNRELNLRMAEYQVRNRLLQEEIEKLQREVRQYRKFRGDLPPALQSSQPSASALPANQTRLVYHRRYEMVRPGNDKTCRVLAYSSYMGMLLISQPSFTALAPGFGVRQFNVMDLKVGSFISLAKDQIRDMSFSQTSPHLLLSCGQDRTARITNMSSSQKVVEFQCDHQIWACDWAANNDHQIFLGTQKGTTLVYDIRHPTAEPTVLPFPDGDKKPIIGLRSVPAKPAAGFPTPGFLVMNLTSLWYWTQEVDNTWSYYKLNLEQKMLWSLDFDASSFLLLVGCKPCPLAMHLVLELNSTQVDNGRVFTASQLMSGRGGSFNQRSFLRSSLLPSPTGQGQVYLAFSKGSGQTDHKVIIQEVGSERILQELRVDKPIIDIKPITINDDKYLALLGETDLIMYKWNAVK